MRTPATNHRAVALSVGFALVCILLTIGTFARFGGSLPLQGHGYRVRIPLPEAQNVVAGSDVRTAGVKIGKVVSIERARNGAVATVELQRRYVPMRTRARAIVRTKTLLGEGYIEVAPGPAGAPALPENGELARLQVRPAVGLDDFLSTFSPSTRAHVRSLIGGVARAFDGRGTAVNDALATSAPLTGDVASVLHTVDAQGPQLGRLVASSGDVLGALGRRTGAVQAAIRSADDLLAVTGRRDRDLAVTVHSLAPFLRELRSTGDVVRGAAPELDRATASASRLVGPLNGTVDATVTTAPALRAAFQAVRRVTPTARGRLPDLTAIVDATPRLLRPLYPTLRETVPLLQLLAAYRESALVGPMGTVAAAANGKLVGPGGKIVTHAGGTAYVSNETVAGWVRRLPTDRSNPYPTPDGLLRMGRQGFLSSYDCRNVHNRAYLPPLGTGVPPCLTQGPWTYRGRTAFYPRLSLAPR